MSKSALPFIVEQDDPRVVTIRMVADRLDWEQWFLLRSDAHRDNLYNVWEVEKLHLEQTTERQAGILDFGDASCCMQGRFDRRLDYDQLPDALRVSAKTYLDAVVSYNAESYIPYAENWVLMAEGNHERSILDHHQTNILERIAERLRMNGSRVKTGPMQGWVRFMFAFCSTHRQSYRLRYHHGYGGGGPVTRDVIQTARQMAFVRNADFLVSGHTHDSWHLTIRTEELRDDGIPVLRSTECLKCPGYKDEYSPGKGWAVGKGHPPKPLGGHWIRFYRDGTHISYEITRAKESANYGMLTK